MMTKCGNSPDSEPLSVRILLAEDEATSRKILTKWLTSWGYEVVACENGAEAWAVWEAEEGRFPVVLTDWMMPMVDGVELCRRIKADPRPGSTYVMLLTCKGDTADKVEGLESGADEYLVKPVQPDELRGRIAVGIRIVSYEANLHNANRELQIYRQAFSHAGQSLFITDPNGGITDINDAFERQFGYGREEVLDRSPALLRPSMRTLRDLGYGDEDATILSSAIEDVLTPEGTGATFEEFPAATADGVVRWLNLFIHPIRGDNGNVVGHFGLPIDQTEHREQERRIRLQIYNAITELAEKRDNETGMHLKRIARTSQHIARALELPAAFVSDIGTFAPLHDIGKVGISDAILLAPRKLTLEEFEVMKTHTEIGWEILRGCPTLEIAAEIVRHHHERWDGTGYPLGLSGGEIPLAARIVSVADVYDALRSRRPYKEPWPHEKAVATITEGAGTQFDPTVVDAFQRVEEQCREVSDRLQDTFPEPEPKPNAADADQRTYRSAV